LWKAWARHLLWRTKLIGHHFWVKEVVAEGGDIGSRRDGNGDKAFRVTKGFNRGAEKFERIPRLGSGRD